MCVSIIRRESITRSHHRQIINQTDGWGYQAVLSSSHLAGYENIRMHMWPSQCVRLSSASFERSRARRATEDGGGGRCSADDQQLSRATLPSRGNIQLLPRVASQLSFDVRLFRSRVSVLPSHTFSAHPAKQPLRQLFSLSDSSSLRSSASLSHHQQPFLHSPNNYSIAILYSVYTFEPWSTQLHPAPLQQADKYVGAVRRNTRQYTTW